MTLEMPSSTRRTRPKRSKEQTINAQPQISQRGRDLQVKVKTSLVKFVWRLGLVSLILLIWEQAVVTGRMDLFFASKPTIIIDELQNLVFSGDFWAVHTYATFRAITYGMIIGTSTGIASALVLAKFNSAYEILSPFITGLYSLPKIALAPILLLWFGIGLASKVALVVSVVYFVMFYNTHAGARAVERDQLNAARMMGASGFQLWRYVIVPSTTPWIMAGIRVSLAFAFTAAVVGELIASQYGLGNLLARASGNFLTGRVFAILTVLGVFGVAIYAVTDRIERRILRWRGNAVDAGNQTASL